MGGSIDLSKAIFGNIGSMMALKVGPEDAEFLENVFAPEFSKADLTNMDKFRGVMRLSVDSQPTKPFSITPYYVLGEQPVHTDEKVDIIKQIASLNRGTKRELVDKEVYFRVGV